MDAAVARVQDARLTVVFQLALAAKARYPAATVGSVRAIDVDQDMARKNIILVGFMGTGKTTVGKIIAAKAGMTFVDSDSVIEEKAGKKVSRIFAEDGEPRFREMERDAVLELSRRQNLVIGAGGGVVLNPANIADFSRSGTVVCLSAAPEAILGRVEGDKSRPLLEDGDKKTRILNLLKSRRKLYDAIPLQVDTTELAPEQVAEKVLGLVG